MAHVYHLICGLVLLLLFYRTGRICLRRLAHPFPNPPLDHHLLSFGLGMGLWSLAVFSMGAIGVLYRVTLLTLSAATLLVTFTVRARPSRALSFPRLGHMPRRVLGLSLLAGVYFVYFYLQSFLPPTDNDGLAYQLALPKIYLLHHRLVYIPYDLHSNWPLLPNMLYIIGLAYDPTGIVATQLHFWAGLGSAVCLYQIASQYTDREPFRWIAVLFFISFVVFRKEITKPYVDLFTTFYVLLAYRLYQLTLARYSPHVWALFGLMGGFAASTKLTGAQYLPLILIVFAVLHAKRFWQSAPSAGIACCLALVVAAPWYARSFLYTGNPFWPFLYSLFAGSNLTPETAAEIYAYHSDYHNISKGVLGFLCLPINLIRFEGYQFRPVQQMIVLLTMAPGLLLVKSARLRKYADVMLIFTLLTIVWYVTSQQVRFALPAFAFLSLALAGLAEELSQTRCWRRVPSFALVGMMFFSMTYRFPFTSVSDFKPFAYLAGRVTRDEFLLRSVDVYAPVSFINANLPADAHVAMIGEVRGFYLDVRYSWTGFNSAEYFRLKGRTVEEVTRLFAARRVTHVLVRKDRLAHEVGDDNVGAYRLWLSRLAVAYEDERYVLYGPLLAGE